MKCPKCHRDMKRIKAKDHEYYYECPSCHYSIGKKDERKEE